MMNSSSLKNLHQRDQTPQEEGSGESVADLQLYVSEDCNPVLVEYPELALESEFSLWQDFCTLDLITAIADQTNLYAKTRRQE